MFDDIQYKLLTRPLLEAYPELADEDGPNLVNYMPMINSMGFQVVVQVDDTGHQGDARFIFRHGSYYGMLIFGWGSCAGCDALQACHRLEDVEALRRTLFNDIHWGTARELHDWMRDRDWDLQWAYHVAGTKAFIATAMSYLDKQARYEGQAA